MTGPSVYWRSSWARALSESDETARHMDKIMVLIIFSSPLVINLYLAKHPDFAPAGHLFERLQQQLLAERGRSYLDQGGTTPLLRAYAIDCPRCSCWSPRSSITAPCFVRSCPNNFTGVCR